MSVLLVIPARGGSKTVTRKNLREVAGKPLIAYAIQNALTAKLVDRVIVSTDDEEIGEIARQYGAEAPFLRPWKGDDMKIVCAWCGMVLAHKNPGERGLVSHGLCPRCEGKLSWELFLEELEHRAQWMSGEEALRLCAGYKALIDSLIRTAHRAELVPAATLSLSEVVGRLRQCREIVWRRSGCMKAM